MLIDSVCEYDLGGVTGACGVFGGLFCRCCGFMWFLLLYVVWVGCYRFLDFRGIGLWWVLLLVF